MRRRRKGTAAVVLMTINTPKKNDDFAKGETHNYDILKFIFKTSSKDLFSCFRIGEEDLLIGNSHFAPNLIINYC